LAKVGRTTDMISRGLVLSGDSQYGFVSIVKLTSGTSSCRLPKNHPSVMTGFCRANTAYQRALSVQEASSAVCLHLQCI